MKRKFAVIGLGRFGSTIALELARLGNEVLGIDSDRRRVDEIADHVTYAALADGEDEKALRELDVANYDAVIVAIGENIEANVLCSLVVKGLGVKQVWAKAVSHNHHRILAKLGVNRIVQPEFEMGQRVAQALNYPMVLDYIYLGHDQYVVEVRATERIAGQTLGKLDFYGRLSLKLLLVKRDRKTLAPPPEDWLVQEDDQFLFVGALANLRLLALEL